MVSGARPGSAGDAALGRFAERPHMVIERGDEVADEQNDLRQQAPQQRGDIDAVAAPGARWQVCLLGGGAHSSAARLSASTRTAPLRAIWRTRRSRGGVCGQPWSPSQRARKHADRKNLFHCPGTCQPEAPARFSPRRCRLLPAAARIPCAAGVFVSCRWRWRAAPRQSAPPWAPRSHPGGCGNVR